MLTFHSMWTPCTLYPGGTRISVWTPSFLHVILCSLLHPFLSNYIHRNQSHHRSLVPICEAKYKHQELDIITVFQRVHHLLSAVNLSSHLTSKWKVASSSRADLPHPPTHVITCPKLPLKSYQPTGSKRRGRTDSRSSEIWASPQTQTTWTPAH